MKFLILAILALALSACAGRHKSPSSAQASAAAVGVKLDELQGNLGSAREGLSEVESKAIRIQEAIRNW